MGPIGLRMGLDGLGRTWFGKKGSKIHGGTRCRSAVAFCRILTVQDECRAYFEIRRESLSPKRPAPGFWINGDARRFVFKFSSRTDGARSMTGLVSLLLGWFRVSRFVGRRRGRLCEAHHVPPTSVSTRCAWAWEDPRTTQAILKVFQAMFDDGSACQILCVDMSPQPETRSP